MRNTTLKIAMAAFFHDIGKFVDADSLDLPKGYHDDNAGSFLPVDNGRYTHRHALYTAGFIEQMEKYLPTQLNTGNWGKGDSFIRLAAAHHSPSSPMEQIITIADRISSGMDREEFDKEDKCSVNFKDYQRTRLLPVFEHLSAADNREPLLSEKSLFQYPLQVQSPESIFPEEKKAIVSKTKRTIKEVYKNLARNFLGDLKLLAHKNLDTALWFEHFDSLVQRFTTSIPAARVGRVIPDVSLYDHLRSTAALATAVYQYHAAMGTLNEKEVNNRKDKKILLLSGSFNGIQNFIFSAYGDSRKYRSKLLRGRSFSVSLLSELAADMLCRNLALPHTSILLTAGGRFTILAPNTENAINTIRQVAAKMNKWLIQRAYGEICITLSAVKASCQDFERSEFEGLWDRVVNAQEKKKFSKIELDTYGGTVESYLDDFCNDLTPAICPLCGKRPADRNIIAGELHTCALCRDHIFLGENLVKEDHIAITGIDSTFPGKKLTDPIFGEYQLFFPKEDPDNMHDADKLIKYWYLGERKQVSTQKIVTSKFINGYVPVYSELKSGEDIEPGAPKTLNDIASAASVKGENGEKAGIEALGILKADVDELGLLMACGLRENMYTVSRLAALSRQMNNFFAIYLPYLLQKETQFNDIYTVFAGGDDLFLIGPWNRIIALAKVLEKQFKAYVCKNKEIHFSAGITLHKPHTPIDTLARTSESALEESKNGGRNRITVFEQTVTWKQFHDLENIRREIEQWLDDGWISSVFLYKINYFIDLAQTEKKLLETCKNGIPIEKMSCTKWRSHLVYAVERNAALKSKQNTRQERVKYIGGRIALWLDSFGGALRIPLWTIQYNRR